MKGREKGREGREERGGREGIGGKGREGIGGKGREGGRKGGEGEGGSEGEGVRKKDLPPSGECKGYRLIHVHSIYLFKV